MNLEKGIYLENKDLLLPWRVTANEIKGFRKSFNLI